MTDRDSIRESLPDPAFFIVGTPRSGTTLVQRLVCEISGVEVPAETHFFSSRWKGSTPYAAGLTRRRRFPLHGLELAEELQIFKDLHTSKVLELDIDDITNRLGGRCDSVAQLFSAILWHLAPSASIIGEKTPAHLQWWLPIATAWPRVRFIGVVRDPRAVITSLQRVPWTTGSPAQQARRWAADQRELRRAASKLGERLMVVRYEDAVSDPDTIRKHLASFLGVPYVRRSEDDVRRIMSPLQAEPWKERVQGAITAERIDVWKESLAPPEARRIASICRSQMRRFRYPVDDAWSLPAPADLWRDLRLRITRARRAAAARRLATAPTLTMERSRGA